MRLTVGDQGFLGAFAKVDTDRIEVVVLAILALSFRKSRPHRTMLLIVADHTVFGEREVNQLYVVRPQSSITFVLDQLIISYACRRSQRVLRTCTCNVNHTSP